MKVRPAASGLTLDEAMRVVMEIESHEALLKFLQVHYESWSPTNENVVIKKYMDGIDERNGWDTYIICVDGKAALFSDGGDFKEVGRGVRPKYVDEHFPRWMKWGGWGAGSSDSKVGDVNDGNQDIVNSVSEEVADKLIKAREEFVDQLQEIFDEHPDQFNVYGPPIK